MSSPPTWCWLRACLPQLFHAIEIDGEAYWDGGYTSNPPVLELAKLGRSRTLLVVRINPADGEGLPHSSPAIRNRMAEIVFGRPLAIELAQLEKIRGLAAARSACCNRSSAAWRGSTCRSSTATRRWPVSTR